MYVHLVLVPMQGWVYLYVHIIKCQVLRGIAFSRLHNKTDMETVFASDGLQKLGTCNLSLWWHDTY
jgi:hypothetical protein